MILYNRNMVPAKCGQVRVKFDAGKVSLHVLHRSRDGGGNSKVLGIDFGHRTFDARRLSRDRG